MSGELRNSGVLAWVANEGEKDECVCVGGKDDNGFGLELYYDADAGIIGGIVRTEGGTIASGFGLVPYTVAVDAA